MNRGRYTRSVRFYFLRIDRKLFMRILCAALAGPGFSYPVVAIARQLQRRGHTIRVATDLTLAPTLAQLDLERVPRSGKDGPSFTVAGWFEPLQVALQYLHLKYAAERFAPDLVLSSYLTLGPVVYCAENTIPLTVVGPVAYLWPLAHEPAGRDPVVSSTAEWRFSELRRAYQRACRAIGIHASDAKLLGDRYLLQSVPSFEPQIATALPGRTRFVGSCLLGRDAPLNEAVEAWVARARAAGRFVAFAQLGRTFGNSDPWPALQAWALRNDVALIASLERYDRALAPAPSDIYRHDGIPLERIVPLVDLVVCSGTAAPILAAIGAAKPMLIACAGSGTEEHAAACVAYGNALAFTASKVHAESFGALANRLFGDPTFARRARELRTAFARYDGPSLAAREVEAVIPGVCA